MRMSNDTKTRDVIDSAVCIVYEFLSVTMSFLLGYMKENATECYKGSQTPGKPLVLVVFFLVCLGFVGNTVIK